MRIRTIANDPIWNHAGQRLSDCRLTYCLCIHLLGNLQIFGYKKIIQSYHTGEPVFWISNHSAPLTAQ